MSRSFLGMGIHTLNSKGGQDFVAENREIEGPYTPPLDVFGSSLSTRFVF